jgi:hypothetical protein
MLVSRLRLLVLLVMKLSGSDSCEPLSRVLLLRFCDGFDPLVARNILNWRETGNNLELVSVTLHMQTLRHT